MEPTETAPESYEEWMCLSRAIPFPDDEEPELPYDISQIRYMAIECEELACMVAMIGTLQHLGTNLMVYKREFSADCHTRVTYPLMEIWAPHGQARVTNVLRIMRDATVWRAVRATAAGVVVKHDLEDCAQEAADVLVELYADQPDPVLFLRCEIGTRLICHRGIYTAGGVNLLREYDWMYDFVRPTDTWDRHIHKCAPSGYRRDHYRWLADRLFGTLLLRFHQLEEQGVITIAHSAVLEDMLEMVTMDVVRDSWSGDLDTFVATCEARQAARRL